MAKQRSRSKKDDRADKVKAQGSGKKKKQQQQPCLSKEEFNEVRRKCLEYHLRREEETRKRCLEETKALEESQKKEAARLRIGFVFVPSDEVLVNYYLKNRTLGISMKFCPIEEVDLYANHPRTLAEKFNPNGGVWYFFTSGRPNENPEVDGQWVLGKKNDVFDNGVKVGTRQEVEFNGEGGENGSNGKYKVIEYQLDPASSTSAPMFVGKLYIDTVKLKGQSERVGI